MLDPSVVIGADVGVRLDCLNEAQLTNLKWLLTVNSRAWKDNPSVTVTGYEERDGRLWIPRQFALEHGYLPNDDFRVLGKPQDLEFKVKLKHSRGQVEAVANMVKYLKANGDGILQAPTGTGKTLMSYAIGSHFHTSLGVFVYAGHMVDNWIKEAKLAFGFGPEDIGIVQQDKCELGRPITIMSIQSLLARRYDDELYNQIGFLIGDEVNRYGAAEWNKAIRQFPGRFRLGVSADPSRKDGLEEVIAWNIGRVGHIIEKLDVDLTVAGLHIDVDYPMNSYRDWKRSEERGEFVGDAMRYDKKLAKDQRRNAVLINQLIKARAKERRIIVFSRFRDHLDTLKDMLDERLRQQSPYYPATTTSYLVGGMKKKAREEALLSDIKFSTYSFARDALNDTSLDTELFATPPGDPLQPAGRLRDHGDEDRNPLLLIDPYESNPYSIAKWEKRVEFYNKRKFKIQQFVRKT